MKYLEERENMYLLVEKSLGILCLGENASCNSDNLLFSEFFMDSSLLGDAGLRNLGHIFALGKGTTDL